jgi:hypothetical protein
MSAQAPEPGPDDEQAASAPEGGQAAFSADGRRRFFWVPGSMGTGEVPLSGPVPASAFPVDTVPGAGPARVLEQQALLDALAAGGFLDGREEDQDAELADELAALEDGRMGPPLSDGQVAALAVEHMDPGPGMAGWLDAALREVDSLDEYGLTGMAMAGRRLASWAQAAELAAVAQVASQAAAADKNIGVRPDGRPARVCKDAANQVSLALKMSDATAAAWADLAVTLAWRLPATGHALATGRIDLYRARRIAEATSVLSEADARKVEAAILPDAWQWTPAQLRERLRRAVIAVDPAAAERRRADAERRAGVSLYPDEDGTATLSGTGLPQVLAAAAMAKITAMARARKAAGLGGGLDLHRAQVMIGLLLGTLPPTPPAEDAPPDQPPTDDDTDPDPSDDGPRNDGPGSDPSHSDRGGPTDADSDCDDPGDVESGCEDNPGDADPGADGACVDGDPGDDVPFPGDGDAPPDDGLNDAGAGDPASGRYADDADDLLTTGPTPEWPELGAIPPALARPQREPDGRPVPGLLDITLPWATFAGLPGGGLGILGRIGPVTPVQARQVAAAAEGDPAAQWRIIITNPAGQAIAVTRIRRPHQRAGPSTARAGPPHPAGLVGRVTLTISQNTLREQATARPGGPDPPGGTAGIVMAALRAAAAALDQALARAGDDAAAGGCAHTDESPGYRPPPRVREFVIARDVTCRSPVCRQPAWRADLDHTIPYDCGGRTCRCNMGGGCRKHHQLKQHPRWKLEQTKPGIFTWTTPAGRVYTVGPDTYPL